jgi:hypothetical protein
MTIYYVDSNATLASVSTVAGDTVLLKTNTLFNAANIPTDWVAKSNITVGEYGTGEKPIIDGGVTYTAASFTQDAPNGVWYISFAHTNYANIVEDGVLLDFVTWTTNIATTAALMPVGSYTNDVTNRRIYIKTYGNSVTGKTYIASETLSAFSSLVANISGFVARNIACTNMSNSCAGFVNLTGSEFDGIDGNVIGSHWDTSALFFNGNGITLGSNCFDGVIKNCTMENIFDSAYCAQTFTAGANVSDIAFLNNTATNCGMDAVEISIAHASSYLTIKNITIDGLVANKIGNNSWSERSGSAYGNVIALLISSANATKSILNVDAHNVTADNVKNVLLLNYIQGISKFYDISATNNTTLLSDLGEYSDISARLYYNFSDSSARTPSGTAKWRETVGLALPTRTILSR